MDLFTWDSFHCPQRERDTERERERGRGRERCNMADLAVDFLLQNLQRLQIYHPHLIREAQNHLEMLENNLHLFQAFLKDSINKWLIGDESVRDLIRQINEVVYEAEDIIDAVVSQAAESKTKKYFLIAFPTPAEKLLAIAKDVESLGLKVRDIYGGRSTIDFAGVHINNDELEEAPLIRKVNNVVGFEDEAYLVIRRLKEQTNHLDIVSIVGMAGLGKTTLAAKVFDHRRIVSEFRIRIWVCVSQDFTQKNVFIAILRELTSVTEDMHRKSNKELAQLIASYLGSRGRFLIVMDDVWTAEDWEELKIAFPKSINMGKILITTRVKKVAVIANPNREPHYMRFLTRHESWILLQSVVFGTQQCPHELMPPAFRIMETCQRLPLAIVVIGGILARANSASHNLSARKWREVAENLDGGLCMDNIISLSYHLLPSHLRTCFHYLRMFPEDFEIPVWKLIRMWVSEGFIQEKANLSLEEVAESYLEDLISRNLVTVDKCNVDGRAKTCRIHDKMLLFCKTKAEYERKNFIREIKKSVDGDFEPPISSVQSYRRLCIHSNVLDFVSSKPWGPRVRSFVCFSRDEIMLPTENVSDIPAGFKLLRLLDANPIKFNRIPSELYHLVHLRYIALSFINVTVLPAAFSKFWNLETLIFDTTSRTLEVKADIWEMIHLRHLKTNASANLLKKEKSNEQGENLQTLGTISSESCTEDFFDRARNLKKLGVRGRLALLLNGKNGSFDSFKKLENLEKLKLINDLFSDSILEGQLHLPPPYKFPPKLRSLTLSDTFLDWSQMSILGMLDNLVILKLKHKAFMGKHWEVGYGTFLHLEVLHIGRTDLFSWIASDDHFPRLRRLELRNCERLQEVPLGFADIRSFQFLDLHRCKSAAASARKICEAKQEKEPKRTETIRKSGFKLSIFPPEDSTPLQGENLQTFDTISPERCTEEFFDRARNLKKFGVRGRLALLLDGKNGSFDGFEKLKNLEMLELINDLFSDSILERQLHLPPPYKFPPKLRSLSLSNTFLDWSQMSILGMLDNLVILKLEYKAFMGKHWEVGNGAFLHLELLHIGQTDLFSWIASDHHFPRLRRLELRNCERLQEVPLGFADIRNFQFLDLYCCKSAAASARKICEAKQGKKRKRTETIRKVGFKLSIFPP